MNLNISIKNLLEKKSKDADLTFQNNNEDLNESKIEQKITSNKEVLTKYDENNDKNIYSKKLSDFDSSLQNNSMTFV